MGNLLKTVQSDNRRATLIALRDETAQAIEETSSGRDKAALINKLLDIMDRLDSMPDPKAKANPAQAAREKVRNRAKAT